MFVAFDMICVLIKVVSLFHVFFHSWVDDKKKTLVERP